jgi:hypothetical protein
VKAARELGRWVFLTPMHDPARAPVVRRAFEDYATGRFTKEQLFKRARNWAPQIGEASRSRRRRFPFLDPLLPKPQQPQDQQGQRERRGSA